MPLTFDATLKDLAADHPRAFLAAFDAPPTEPLALLNVDLSTVTAAADLVIGLGTLNDSGYSGVATLHDNGDGTTTVNVYLMHAGGM